MTPISLFLNLAPSQTVHTVEKHCTQSNIALGKKIMKEDSYYSTGHITVIIMSHIKYCKCIHVPKIVQCDRHIKLIPDYYPVGVLSLVWWLTPIVSDL
jgi:hypothetical protein